MSTTTNESGPPLEAAVTSVKQKRTAERQLTKDDDPDDGDDADSGDFTSPFHKADEQVLKGRRILKARRPVSKSTTAVAAAAAAAAAPSTITTTTVTTTTDSSVPTNPFASTTLIVEPSVVPLPAPGPATGPTTLPDTKHAGVIVTGTSKEEQVHEQDKEQPTVNQEQTKDTNSEAETSTAQATPNIPTATTTTTASTSGPFKVFGSFAGFGGGFSTTGFGTAAAAGTIHATAATPATSTPTDSTTTAKSATTGFAFASSPSNSFGIAPSTTTSSIFGSVSNNSFSFGFTNQTNGGEVQTISPKITLPESVELTTGEEEELNLHDCRCKTFKWVPAFETEESTPAATKTTLSVKPSKDFQIQITDAAKDDAAAVAATPNDTDQETTDNKNGHEKHQRQQQQQEELPSFRWQELGVGPMKLLQDNSDPPKYRLVQRRESNPNGPATKVLLNLPLYKESKVSLKTGQENYLSFITIGHDGRNETYLWKFKEISQAQMFARFLDGILPHARSCFVG